MPVVNLSWCTSGVLLLGSLMLSVVTIAPGAEYFFTTTCLLLSSREPSWQQ